MQLSNSKREKNKTVKNLYYAEIFLYSFLIVDVDRFSLANSFFSSSDQFFLLPVLLLLSPLLIL